MNSKTNYLQKAYESLLLYGYCSVFEDELLPHMNKLRRMGFIKRGRNGIWMTGYRVVPGKEEALKKYLRVREAAEAI